MRYSGLRALAALIGALLLSAAALADSISFSANGDKPVVTFAQTHGMVRGLIEKPLLYIYADGRVVVDRPAYMVRPGRYEFTLSAEELAALVATFDQGGVLELDARELNRAREAKALAMRNATGEMFVTTDSTKTHLSFDFAAFARAGARPAPLVNAIEFADVQVQAQRYKDLKALSALADAEKQLLALIDHPDMKAVAANTGGQSND